MSVRMPPDRHSHLPARSGGWRQFATPLAMVASVWFLLELCVRIANQRWGNAPGASGIGYEPFVLLLVALGAAAIAWTQRTPRPQKPRPGNRQPLPQAARAPVVPIREARYADGEPLRRPIERPLSSGGLKRSA